MQLILISGARARTRSLTLGPIQCFFAVFGAILAVMALAFLLQFILIKAGWIQHFPSLQSSLLAKETDAFEQDEQRRQENINAMAVRIGNLQAKVLQLDMLGRHLKEATGIDDEHLEGQIQKVKGTLPQGGPYIPASQIDSEEDLKEMIDQLTLDVERRLNYLVFVEDKLLSESVREQLFPGQIPVDAVYMTSRFGTRFDPFTRRVSRHAGVDFAAPVGAEILSAASGVVLRAEYHPAYGYVVDLDHGNGLTTRYGHCSRLFVKKGEFVKSGTRIAAAGSTGRSTGPHLHFEVRKNGTPVNPLQFLHSKVPTKEEVLARRAKG